MTNGVTRGWNDRRSASWTAIAVNLTDSSKLMRFSLHNIEGVFVLFCVLFFVLFFTQF